MSNKTFEDPDFNLAMFEAEVWIGLNVKEKITILEQNQNWFKENIDRPAAFFILNNVRLLSKESDTLFDIYLALLKSSCLQHPEKAQSLVDNITSSGLENDEKDLLYMFVLSAFEDHFDEHLEFLLGLREKLNFQMFRQSSKWFLDFDTKRFESFKAFFGKNNRWKNKNHMLQELKNAFIRTFKHSKQNLYTMLFAEKEFVLLKRIFDAVSNVEDEELLKQFDTLADSFLESMPIYISEPDGDKSEYHLFQSLQKFQDKRVKYFDKSNWPDHKQEILQAIFGEDDPEPAVSRALEHLARHARWFLDTDKTNPRADAGRQKYKDLTDLFTRLSEAETRQATREILEQHLDNNPNTTPLFKNRKGHGGLYEKIGEVLGKHGLFHFHYQHGDVSHNMVSSTHRGLNVLYDAIRAVGGEELTR